MAKSLPSINVSSDTFQIFIDKTNSIISLVGTEVVTANNSANGAVTTGNTYLNGILHAVTLTTTSLRGGNVSTSSPLNISSNVIFDSTFSLNFTSSVVNNSILRIGNTTVNTFANATNIIVNDIDATIANVTSSTIEILTTNSVLVKNDISVGNSSINVAVLSNSISVSNSILSSLLLSNSFFVGNSVTSSKINSSSVAVGNSSFYTTVNSSSVTISNTSGTFFIDASPTVSNSEYNTRFKFFTATTSGNSSQLIDSFEKNQYRTVEYVVSIRDNNANAFMSSKILCSHDDNSTDAYLTEYATMISNSTLGIFSAISNATHVLLNFTPTSTNTSVSFGRISLNV